MVVSDAKNNTKYTKNLSGFGYLRLNSHNFLFDIESSKYKTNKRLEPKPKNILLTLDNPFSLINAEIKKTVIAKARHIVR